MHGEAHRRGSHVRWLLPLRFISVERHSTVHRVCVCKHRESGLEHQDLERLACVLEGERSCPPGTPAAGRAPRRPGQGSIWGCSAGNFTKSLSLSVRTSGWGFFCCWVVFFFIQLYLHLLQRGSLLSRAWIIYYLLGHADNRLLGFVFSVSESCGELQNWKLNVKSCTLLAIGERMHLGLRCLDPFLFPCKFKCESESMERKYTHT